MNSPTLLSVRRLCLKRSARTLIHEFGFDLASGHYLELTGANGSGKSSLLRALSGLIELSPQARIDRPARLFHFASRPGFRTEFSVRQQLHDSLSLLIGAPSTQQCAELIALVGLTRQEEQRVGQLSEGQIRRLMLAVMQGANAKLWLIDEPLNALDEEGIALFGRMLEHHLANGGAALVATHQSLTARLPGLSAYAAGRLVLANRRATLRPAPPSPAPPFPPSPAHTSSPAGLIWVLKREFALLAARPQDALWPAIFHWMVVSLFPFGLSGLGSDTLLAAKLAPGVFWVSALLALLLASQRLYLHDHDAGVFDQMRIAGLSLSSLTTGKVVALWLAVGVPISLSSLPLGLQYALSGPQMLALVGSMLIGLPVVCALCALFAALGLLARQAQVVVSLLALPTFVPVLVFGTAVTGSLQAGLSPAAPLGVLASLSLLSLLAVPVVTAKLLSLLLD